MPAPFFFAQCNAMVDLVVDVSDEFIAETKLLRGQAQLADSDEHAQKVFADACARFPEKPPRITPGGSGLATARCVNWILKENSSSEKDSEFPLTSVLSIIGDDAHGRLMKDSLSSEGVDTTCLVSLAHDDALPKKPRATGVCLVLVTPDGERTMLVTIGAWQNLEIFDKKSDAEAALLMTTQPALQKSSALRAECDIQYATGFAVVASGAFLLHSALGLDGRGSPNCRFCNGSPHSQKDQILAGNISAQYVVDAFNASLISFLTEVDIIFGNFEEAKALASSIISKKENDNNNTENDEKQILQSTTSVAEFLASYFLHRRSTSTWRCGGCLKTNNDGSSQETTITVVVTNGSEDIGICSAIGSKSSSSSSSSGGKVDIKHKSQSFKVPKLREDQKIVDTCNAGDCFVGGFFAGMKLFVPSSSSEQLATIWRQGVKSWISSSSSSSSGFEQWMSKCVRLGIMSAAVVICQTGCTLPAGAAPKQQDV